MTVRPDIPEPGFYRVRMVKGGPWIPVSIAFSASQEDRSPMWVVMRGTEYVDVWDVWPGCSGGRIDEDEYRYLVALIEHAKADPTAPEARPREKIDWNKLPASF